jgi:hypothetical protein
MAAFFHLLLVHIVGFHRILYSCPINPSDGEHMEQPVQRPTQQQQQQQQLQQPYQPQAVDYYLESTDTGYTAHPQQPVAQPAGSSSIRTSTSATTRVSFG